MVTTAIITVIVILLVIVRVKMVFSHNNTTNNSNKKNNILRIAFSPGGSYYHCVASRYTAIMIDEFWHFACYDGFGPNDL